MIDYKNVQPLDDFNWDEFESGSKAGNGEGELTKAYDCLLYTSDAADE